MGHSNVGPPLTSTSVKQAKPVLRENKMDEFPIFQKFPLSHIASLWCVIFLKVDFISGDNDWILIWPSTWKNFNGNKIEFGQHLDSRAHHAIITWTIVNTISRPNPPVTNLPELNRHATSCTDILSLIDNWMSFPVNGLGYRLAHDLVKKLNVFLMDEFSSNWTRCKKSIISVKHSTTIINI